MTENTVPTPDEVRAEIRTHVKDPELMMNIVDLGLVYDIEVTEQSSIDVTMTLTSPGCPVGPQIISDVQRTAHTAFPNVDEVNVHLVWTPFWSPDMMSEDAKDELGMDLLSGVGCAVSAGMNDGWVVRLEACGHV